MRDPKERLRDILDAIARIERYASRGREAFEHDELIQVWIFHHIQIIGEAAANLGRDFHEAHPEVPWPQIVAIAMCWFTNTSEWTSGRSGRPWSAICPL
jgi:uncharacterized protein with HEPN domain